MQQKDPEIKEGTELVETFPILNYNFSTPPVNIFLSVFILFRFFLLKCANTIHIDLNLNLKEIHYHQKLNC